MDLRRNKQCDTYSYNMVEPAADVQLNRKIDQRWIQGFTDRFRIIFCSVTGCRSLVSAKLEEVENYVAANLGKISVKLSFGLWDEQDVGSADETYFSVNFDNRETLGLCADKQVKYGDFVSGGECFKMMMRLSGELSPRIEPPFLIIKNKDRKYPIRGIPDYE